MVDLHRTHTCAYETSKEMDSDDDSVAECDEKDMEFSSSFERHYYWTASDIENIMASSRSDGTSGTSGDVSMAPTLVVDDASRSDENDGDLGHHGQVQTVHDRYEDLMRIVRLVLLFVFGYDPLNVQYPDL